MPVADHMGQLLMQVVPVDLGKLGELRCADERTQLGDPLTQFIVLAEQPRLPSVTHQSSLGSPVSGTSSSGPRIELHAKWEEAQLF